MKKLLVMAGALAAAGLSAATASQSAPEPSPAPAKAGRTVSITPQRQAPQKQATAPITKRVTLKQQAPLLDYLMPVRWVERPQLRRVKYGKRRWVTL